jgi:hypothetical protein
VSLGDVAAFADVAAAGAVTQAVAAQDVGAGKIAAAIAPAADADTGVPAAASSAPVGPEENRADGKVAGSSIRVHVAAMAAATCSFIAPQGGAITA